MLTRSQQKSPQQVDFGGQKVLPQHVLLLGMQIWLDGWLTVLLIQQASRTTRSASGSFT